MSRGVEKQTFASVRKNTEANMESTQALITESGSGRREDHETPPNQNDLILPSNALKIAQKDPLFQPWK